ncbi:hypothetical protein GCM10017688_46810 [Streptomyces ramulosus]
MPHLCGRAHSTVRRGRGLTLRLSTEVVHRLLIRGFTGSGQSSHPGAAGPGPGKRPHRPRSGAAASAHSWHHAAAESTGTEYPELPHPHLQAAKSRSDPPSVS